MIEFDKLSLEQLLMHKNDHASCYWTGMAYLERYDYGNDIEWLEKAVNDPGNERAGKARANLALLHYGGGFPQASKDEALRLFEKNLNGSMSTKLYAGFLYLKGTGTKQNNAKGKELIEAVIEQLVKGDGNDNYLSQSECWKIGWMYYKEHSGKAYQWFEKCKAR
ncbi:MAG: hypothetical protein LBE56_13530 [Tannerella sp.]|nr:hypothetical protein [Tannerella sp.]